MTCLGTRAIKQAGSLLHNMARRNCGAGILLCPPEQPPPKKECAGPASPRRSRCAPSTAAVGSGWRAESWFSERQHDSTVAAVGDRRRLRRPRTESGAMIRESILRCPLRCLAPLRLCVFASAVRCLAMLAHAFKSAICMLRLSSVSNVRCVRCDGAMPLRLCAFAPCGGFLPRS